MIPLGVFELYLCYNYNSRSLGLKPNGLNTNMIGLFLLLEG